MPRPATVNISMPPTLRSFVKGRVRRKGFGNVSEYFRDLVRADVARAKDEEQLEAMLMQGLRSGRPLVVDKAWLARKKAALANRLKRRVKAG